MDAGFSFENPRPIISGINAQAPTSESSKSGQSILTQSYTSPANDNNIRRVISLASVKCWK